MGELAVAFDFNEDQGRFSLSIDGSRIPGQLKGISDEIVGMEHENVYGIAYELGGRAGLKGLELKMVVLCSGNQILAINFGKNECLVVREEEEEEDHRLGIVRIHPTAIALFQNPNNTMVGFNLGNLIFHLSGLGVNIAANFVDLSCRGIKNWEKGMMKHLQKTKIQSTIPTSSGVANYSAAAYFSRRIQLHLNS